VPAVCVRHLSRSFEGRVALSDVSFSVQPGERVALLGASGSGKSTLLRHLCGFIVADSGYVQVLERTVQSDGRLQPGVRALRSRIGFVFQQFNLVGRLTVITNVLVGQLHRTPWWRSLSMCFSQRQREAALRALAAVGIEQSAWQRAATLSGGQQQRAALARCLVQQAQLILADEPIASLDPESARKVMELLVQLNEQHQCTVLVCLHQVEMALRYCPRTIALDAGRIVYDGPSDALTPSMLARLYAGRGDAMAEPSGDRPVTVH
jgi:phosphonate transport system ATP-binding protein